MPSRECGTIFDNITSVPLDPSFVERLVLLALTFIKETNMTYNGSIVIWANDVEITLVKHLLHHILDGLLGCPCSLRFLGGPSS